MFYDPKSVIMHIDSTLPVTIKELTSPVQNMDQGEWIMTHESLRLAYQLSVDVIWTHTILTAYYTCCMFTQINHRLYTTSHFLFN